jgi:hypothetical protein
MGEAEADKKYKTLQLHMLGQKILSWKIVVDFL